MTSKAIAASLRTIAERSLCAPDVMRNAALEVERMAARIAELEAALAGARDAVLDDVMDEIDHMIEPRHPDDSLIDVGRRIALQDALFALDRRFKGDRP